MAADGCSERTNAVVGTIDEAFRTAAGSHDGMAKGAASAAASETVAHSIDKEEEESSGVGCCSAYCMDLTFLVDEPLRFLEARVEDAHKRLFFASAKVPSPTTSSEAGTVTTMGSNSLVLDTSTERYTIVIPKMAQRPIPSKRTGSFVYAPDIWTSVDTATTAATSSSGCTTASFSVTANSVVGASMSPTLATSNLPHSSSVANFRLAGDSTCEDSIRRAPGTRRIRLGGASEYLPSHTSCTQARNPASSISLAKMNTWVEWGYFVDTEDDGELIARSNSIDDMRRKILLRNANRNQYTCAAARAQQRRHFMSKEIAALKKKSPEYSLGSIFLSSD